MDIMDHQDFVTFEVSLLQLPLSTLSDVCLPLNIDYNIER